MTAQDTPPRYCEERFPPYRYLPFQADIPHPKFDPAGHSYGKDEEYLPDFSPEDWRQCQPYLYGVDLFNHGYWWEAHEAWEAVWLAAGQKTPAGLFVQGLIMLAAAQLKRVQKQRRGAQSLTASGREKLQQTKGEFLGIEVAPLIAAAERCLVEDREEFPIIRLKI